ncbi:NmrA family transcriptional regulator [Devosia yakushimensis]|uniref:NmrA family transcriptional regulator n=1 Tax=Devosia yakushimensis TaxID=470028 RepID=A0ABQ5UC24_9HYPH|nr:NmrA/HSCARG family protein [Devosia yakushimensis]GLQ09391.1 NmrA family transcriptional regulator [Devosia yakushimensis]
MTNLEQPGPILVSGATGKQGGATARALLLAGATVHALVRNPDTDAARKIEDLGARLVIGDLDDAASILAACSGVYGVFSVQNPDFNDLEADTEEVRGRNLIKAAQAAGVTHFIQTSATGVGEYYRQSGWGEQRRDNNSLVIKGELEDRVRAAGFPFWTILRPTFFMENLPFVMRGDRLVTAYDAGSPVPLIAADDIGVAAASAFSNRERFHGVSIELAGDYLSMPEVAKILSEAWGRTIEAPAMTPGQVLAEGFFLPMVEAQEWHNEVGLPARPEVARSFGLKTTTLQKWATNNADAFAG